jgi:hypothetical protein
MATVDRTTTTYPTDAASTTAVRAAFTTPLREAFVRGNQIRAADLNLLRSAVVGFNAHTHSVLDYSAIAEFGNNGPRTVLSGNPRVSAAMTGGSTPTEVTQNTLIRHTDVNTLVAGVNAAIGHVHVISDTTTA